MTKKETPTTESREVLKEMSEAILQTFNNFNTPIEIFKAVDGYRNHHFYIRPTKPMRMKAFAGYLEDLKYALSNDAVEIEAPVPNEKYVGITVPKKSDPDPVLLSEALRWNEYLTSAPLVVPLGIDELGNRQMFDIAKAPHTLVAGTTGSGKSMLMHTIIRALIQKNTPEKVRFIFGDPKRTELIQYSELPHSLASTITDARKMVRALGWAVKEMERRYDILEREKQMSITSYHKDVYQPSKAQNKKDVSSESGLAERPEALPYIVIMIDELSDFIQTYPTEIEECLVRLAQMSRGVGIHIILTTQRPSVKVITGAIKANIPTRIALAAASQVDSRAIIDTTGAEKLRGSGDMLYQGALDPQTRRLQALYVPDEELLDFVKGTISPIDDSQALLDKLDFSDQERSDPYGWSSLASDEGEDELYEDAKQAVLAADKASTSYLQRKLRIGYSRAAMILDRLEYEGVIGPADGAKPREVLKREEVLEVGIDDNELGTHAGKDVDEVIKNYDNLTK